MSFNYLLPVLALLSACASPPSSTALQWQSAPPMQFARAAHAVAADDSGIYVLGGTGAGGKPVLEVEHFDGRQWRVISQLPAGGLNAPTAVMHDGQLWLIGGFFTDSNIPGAQVWRFDPQIRRWQQETPLPAPRGGHASAIYQGRLHVFGGGNDERTLDEHLAYDFNSRQWRSLPALPRSEGSPAAAVLDGALYAIGGRSGYSDFGDVYRFQVETGWQSAPGIPPRGTAGAISHCGKLWVFGGESQSSGKVLAEVFSYSPVDKTWRTQTPLPQARNFARAVWFNNAVWVVGGSLSAGNSHAAQGSAVVEMAGLGCE